MFKLIGIFIIIILFSAGLFYFFYSTATRRAMETEKRIAVQARNIDALQKGLGALKKDVVLLGASGKKPVHAHQYEVETASLRQKLLTLESEVAAIRVLLEGEIKLRSQIRDAGILAASKTAKDESLESPWQDSDKTQNGDREWTPELADAEQERVNNQLRQLDDLMISDEPDPQWSMMMIDKLENLLDEVAVSVDSGVTINSYDCKSKLCLIEALTKGLEPSHGFEQVLLDNMDEDAPQMITTRDEHENGDVTTKFYLIKGGESLNQMLSAE